MNIIPISYNSLVKKISNEYINLYTVQDIRILNFFHDGKFIVDNDNVEMIKDITTSYSYNWIKDKMNLDHYPIWSSIKRIKRKRKLRLSDGKYCEIKFKSKVSDCLITDYDEWHCCLNMGPTNDYEGDDFCEIMRSWDSIIFPTSYKKKISVQVCTPCLYKTDILSIKYL